MDNTFTAFINKDIGFDIINVKQKSLFYKGMYQMKESLRIAVMKLLHKNKLKNKFRLVFFWLTY
jgi:hypothetical protein